MITSLNEFYFSKHYFYDNDNRFKLRVLDAKIMNNLSDMTKAKARFKQAMAYFCLEKLDKLSTTYNNVGLVIGNVFFRENGKIQAADLVVDKSEGNTYIAIIGNDTVVTLMLVSGNMSNGDIFAKHDNEKDHSKLDKLIDINGKDLDLNSKKRETIIIDLDMDYAEFNKLYPVAKLKNNKWSTANFSKEEISDIEEHNKKREKDEIANKEHFSPSAIPEDLKAQVPDKEFVIYEGMKILVFVNNEIKWKTIKKLIINEKGEKREFSLEFENTLKPMPLEIGSAFVITPEMKNEEYSKLLKAFNIDDYSKLSFIGKITKFNFYKKGKSNSKVDKLGVLINSRQYIKTPN